MMNSIAEGDNQPGHHQDEKIDPQVILRAQQGDLNAFNELVLAYQDRVYRQAFWLTGQECMAEDTTQIAFLRAYQNISQFRGSSFKAWIMKIVTNLCYDALRHHKRHPTMSLDDHDDSTDEDGPIARVIDPQATPEEGVERNEMVTALWTAVNQLPLEYRNLLILVDIQGFEYREAAAALHIPLGTVKSRLARARLQLSRACTGSINCLAGEIDE